MSTIVDCPFCNLKDRVLKTNTLANLFLSNPRKVPGHFLVTPKRHVEKPWELTSDELQAIFDLIYFAQRKVTNSLSEGCDVRQHYRPFMKQGRIKIDHVHYHIIPRDLNDEIYQKVEKYDTDLFVDLDNKEYEAMAKVIEEEG